MKIVITTDKIRTRVIRWKGLRPNTGITIPLGRWTPGSEVIILHNTKPHHSDINSRTGMSARLETHELGHVDQYQRWGFWGYWRRHIWARLRTIRISHKSVLTIDLMAKCSDVERPIYLKSHGAEYVEEQCERN